MGEFSPGTQTFWYSDARPKGQGREGIEYDKHMYDLVEKTIYKLQKHQHGSEAVTNDEVRVLQNYFVDIGYLDSHYIDSYGNPHDSIDGYVGGRTHGAAMRYLYNFGGDKMNADIWNFVEKAGKRMERGWNRIFN